MLVLIVGGAYIAFTRVKQEIFPAFEIDLIHISIPYPGASPAEVEKGIILAVEEAVQGIEGIDNVNAVAGEGYADVRVELLNDTDKTKVSADIKNAVDRITSFPSEAEEPTVQVVTTRRSVLSLIIYGDAGEAALRNIAEQVRNDLLKRDEITQVELTGIRPREIAVEISNETLRSFGLTIADVAAQIRNTAVELPGGGVKTGGGEILIRTAERRDWGREFAQIPIVHSRTGTRVRLGEIATIRDDFEDVDVMSFFNKHRAVRVRVYRIGDQTPLAVARAVKEYKAVLDENLPGGVYSALWADRSVIYHQRIDLLKRNATIGLFLVLGILGLFLEIRLAFWVTLGIPISFLGAFLFLPLADVSINMISLFGFIVTLGMVVDDAIIIGESIYVHREMGKTAIRAAVDGAHEVAEPVIFSIVTTAVAFAPMFFVVGTMGKVFRILPAVVITVLALSLFESLFILPAHLAHLGKTPDRGVAGAIHRLQQRFGKMVVRFSETVYGPAVRGAVKNRWIVWAVSASLLIICAGLVQGGRIKILRFPKIESDWVVADAKLPYGISLDQTFAVKQRLEASCEQICRSQNEKSTDSICRGIYTWINGSHDLTVIAYLTPGDKRRIGAIHFVDKWRRAIGDLPVVETLQFDATAGGPSGGKPVDVQLSHSDVSVLEQAATHLAERLSGYAGVHDIDDGFTSGKPQLDLTIRPEAEGLGLSPLSLGRQIRHYFQGAEALRQQRGRDTLKVVVRLPESERTSEYDVEQLLIRTPRGGEIPLHQAADVKRGRAYTSIRRSNGRRTLNVTAEVDTKTTLPQKVIEALKKTDLPALTDQYPGLSWTFEGAQRSGNESMQSLFAGFIVALLVMYVLIAVPFKSYFQPLVVLSAIPFGLIGALAGHMIMGFHVSLISMMGLLALSGVVVNDSLVLIHTANRYRNQGRQIETAITDAGIRRFRPIILTSLTTFLGLTPMIFETSLQARFLIPMALSLGFGVLFATAIILLIVPAFYVILEDILNLLREIPNDTARLTGRNRRRRPSVGVEFDGIAKNHPDD